MKNLFGKKTKDSQSKNTMDPLKTIEELTTKIDHMEEKIRFIETRKKNLNEQAKIKLKAGDKNAARQALAKKKKYDDQIKQFDGAIMLMEEQKMMLEGAESMRAVLESIKKANTILASTQKGMNVEDIVNIKEELEEYKYNQKELTDIFAEYTTQEDQEVEDELDKLASELEKEELPAASERIKIIFKYKKLENIPEKLKEEKVKVVDTVNKAKKDEKQLEDFLVS